ncbi:ferritin-like domain-containing protein [Campylobacter upsaliensis]|uniref:ferritin-like domain-containing protein n=1 Tax=Campylobacter upsaliensis TaxID=28080 RepID=UPI002B3E20B3|nr:ferritin-like domain-containing protein [Campylobacter upsaliensis]MEB2803259.1 ferritin-like domain-containing protein [Campylobacter upsaliensis]MEB2811384.1 ferritin-like domain-containing protein [Campylobacter upsaliensis]MEB2822332.1 ferritin-like domain-containing protein [Campylobacter upsaliensis]
MKKEFFSELEKILYEKNLKLKFELFDNFYEEFQKENLIFNHEHFAIFQNNTYEKIKILHPTRIRRPKSTNSTQALAKIIHSIAHIEFSAINLALDASYRFKNLPLEFYKDWLEVAKDEMRHFKLLNRALEELNFEYGSFEAHENLEDALKATKNSLKYRMGVVHRGLEAKGLDANPFVLKKIQNSNHSIKPFLEEILQIILEEEIIHVKKGDFWWNFAKDERDDYLSLCRQFKEFNLAGKKLNDEARLKAGFSKQELEELKDFYS